MQNSLLLFVSFDFPFNYILQKISSKALLSILSSYILVYVLIHCLLQSQFLLNGYCVLGILLNTLYTL